MGTWLILAQPLVQEDRVSKVAVVMLPTEQQEMLRIQIESLKPEILEPADHYLLK